MNSSFSRPKIVGRSITSLTGNPHKSLYDPRTHDELRHILNLLTDLRVVIVDQSNPRKNVLILTDRRAVLPLAIPPAAPAGLQGPFHVKQVLDEYLRCRTWNATSMKEGTKDVKIAKIGELRTSRVVELLPDGTTFTYSAWDNDQQSRHASGDDGTEEDQFVTPRWLIADETTNQDAVIYAMSATTNAQDEDGKTISLMEVSPRAWAAPQ